ncbi:MAG: HAMP domain-containing protein [Clostridia bacterium]|nr:HAMP domain-containing protein [Clostridia bacterium]
MKGKLWVRIFIRIAVIFAVFFLVLTCANRLFLPSFFKASEKNLLREQAEIVKNLDLADNAAVARHLSTVSDTYNFEVEIYHRKSGEIIYTSYSSQIIDFHYKENPGMAMNHKSLEVIKREKHGSDSVFETAFDRQTQTEYMIYRTAMEDGVRVELRVQTGLLENSAQIAERFIGIIALICLGAALVWTYFSVRRISKPISEMSEITGAMAALSFDRKVTVNSNDEIGRLGASVNELSGKLSATLEDLKKSNAQLRDEIELERELDSMRRGFVANVSHELKTPISIISGYAEGLKLNVNSASREQYCDTIIDESARMNRLVLSLLELSKYESGQIPINKVNFSLTELIKNLGERLFADSDITLILPDGDTNCFADPMQIEQVLKSLLENAKCHTPQGGTVEVRVLDGEELRVEVHNSGSHVSEEQMPKIWQSFYRGEESHKREESRFGLGLSIVGAICKQHGKDCGVYNTESGVCFWFALDKE